MFKTENSFTLIELVIVLGILAVLAVVVILVLNPSEFLKQARDSTRLSDLQTINSVIGQYQADGGTSIGSSNTVYVSIPSSQGDCSDLGLPVLPDDWFYACSDSDNYRKVTGNGWIPINLTSVSYGSPLDALPIDPINSTSTGDYYTYVTGGSWELNAILESSKYRTNTSITKQNLPGVFAVGSNLTLSPIFNNSGIVGYWKFDEGSGTTASDSSGNNTGTLTYGPTWTTGKVGNALSFDGGNDWVDAGNGASLNFGTAGSFSISVWVNALSQSEDYPAVIEKSTNYYGDWGNMGSAQNGFILFYQTYYNQYIFEMSESGASAGFDYIYLGNLNNAGWKHVVISVNASSINGYINGIIYSSNARGSASDGSIDTTNNLNIGQWALPARNFNGLIDDVRIYNRALSAAEIMAIYNATK